MIEIVEIILHLSEKGYAKFYEKEEYAYYAENCDELWIDDTGDLCVLVSIRTESENAMRLKLAYDNT